VSYLLSRKKKLNMDLDPMTLQALIMGLVDNGQKGTLTGHYTAIHQAYELHTLPPSDLNRHILEARLLSGQTDDEIANSCSISPEAISLYERLFYNVRDRLDKIDYIVANALGQVFQGGLGDYNPTLLMKYFAYFAGPLMLSMVLTGFSRRRSVTTDDEVLGYLDSQIEHNWKLQTLAMSTSLQPGRFTVRDIIEGYTQLKTLEVRQTSAPEQSAWVSSFVSYLSQRCPAPRGSEAQNLVGTPIANYAAGTVELRASEQLQRASIQGLPYLGDLESFKLPEN